MLLQRAAGSQTPKPGSPASAASTPIPDDARGANLPLTMSASVVLSSLPRDAHQALTDVEAIDTGKGMWLLFCLLYPLF